MERFKNYIPRYTLIYMLQIAIISLGVNAVVEIFNRRSVLDAIVHIGTNFPVFLYNSFIIFSLLMLSLLFRHRLFAILIISLCWIILGVVNTCLLSFRVTPFSFVDIAMLKDAISLIPTYFTFMNIVSVVLATAAVVTFVVIAFKKIPKDETKVHRIPNAILFALAIMLSLGLTSLGVKTNLLARNFGNLADAYKDYGFVYCFVNSAINTGIKKPDNYSEEIIEAIAQETEDETPVVPETKPVQPNIIMVQLESFFDPNYMKNFVYSKNPVENFTKLKEEFPSGFLSVPSIGAGTANTEFETITGMCLDFFGPGEYPYKTILRNTTCESIPYQLKLNGYSTHAMHNHDGTFYNRHTVFPNLGFDTFTPLEYMLHPENNPTGWPKDEVLTEEIMRVLNSTENSDFLYTISVQGHGKYPHDRETYLPLMVDSGFSDELKHAENAQPSMDPEELDRYYNSDNFINITGIEENRKFPFEYYVNQINEMDDFIGHLIEALSKIEEDTVLVLFGDHLPSLDITTEELYNGDLFQTEYVIWNNFGLDCEDRNLESFQLGAYVLEQLGYDCGYLTKIHQSNQYDISQYSEKLKLLQYDMLYGDKAIYNFVNPYNPVDMKMGVEDIKINAVQRENTILLIAGDNFTEYSHVYINGKDLKTAYITENLLVVEFDPSDELLTITVGQQGNDDIVLGSSLPYEYADSKLISIEDTLTPTP